MIKKTIKNPKIFVAGHKGMVGSSILRQLTNKGYKNIITIDRNNLDLKDQSQVKSFFNNEKPDQVYIAAAKVGGIYANNNFPAEFIYENLMIQSNIIHEAWSSGVKKLLFLGSSCIYPKYANQPIKEYELLNGELEPTNEPYAISKIAGIKLCESYNRQHGVDFRSIMPTNLYGPGDNYHPSNSHVIPALIHRFHQAKLNNDQVVKIWGSGTPKREFLYVDDLADACVTVMNAKFSSLKKLTKSMQSHLNVGSSKEISIADLSILVSGCINFKGKIEFDYNKPDGTPRKLLDSSKMLELGWRPKVNLLDGLKMTYEDYLNNNS